MKGSFKGLAGTLLLAGSLAFGAGAFAADSAPAKPDAAKEAKAQCMKEGKEQKLAGKKLAAYVKKCTADAAAAAKK